MSTLRKTMLVAGFLIAVAACSEAPDNTIRKDGDGMPSGDTGWTSNLVGETLVLQRQLNQLSLKYELAPAGESVESTVTAAAKPCLNGKGEQSYSESFEPLSFDDASELSQIRDRIDEVVSSIDDRCTIPQETIDEIASGFDGLYFRTAEERASVAGE